MKTKYILLSIATAVLMSGCNYLDIVPEERNTPEDTYKNPAAAGAFCTLVIANCPTPENLSILTNIRLGKFVFRWRRMTFRLFRADTIHLSF